MCGCGRGRSSGACRPSIPNSAIRLRCPPSHLHHIKQVVERKTGKFVRAHAGKINLASVKGHCQQNLQGFAGEIVHVHTWGVRGERGVKVGTHSPNAVLRAMGRGGVDTRSPSMIDGPNARLLNCRLTNSCCTGSSILFRMVLTRSGSTYRHTSFASLRAPWEATAGKMGSWMGPSWACCIDKWMPANDICVAPWQRGGDGMWKRWGHNS